MTSPFSISPFSRIDLVDPAGDPRPLADFSGRPVLVQVLRYFG